MQLRPLRRPDFLVYASEHTKPKCACDPCLCVESRPVTKLNNWTCMAVANQWRLDNSIGRRHRKLSIFALGKNSYNSIKYKSTDWNSTESQTKGIRSLVRQGSLKGSLIGSPGPILQNKNEVFTENQTLILSKPYQSGVAHQPWTSSLSSCVRREKSQQLSSSPLFLG